MHPQSFAILDVLLRAGLCDPRVWEQSFDALPSLARDESLDALSQAGLPLPQVIWEWAGTYGHVTLLQRNEADLDLTEFYEALEDIATHFGLELSTTAHTAIFGVMPTFPEQRIHLVQRTTWYPLQPAEDETEREQVAIPDDLPVLTEPEIADGTQRVGETWIRLPPDTITALKQDSLALLYFLRTIADTRIEQLRKHQSGMYEPELTRLNETLARVTSWQRLIHTCITPLERLSLEKQKRVAPGILTILATLEAPTPPTAEELPDLKQTLRRIIGTLPRPIAIALLALVTIITGSYAVWTSLPDTTKQHLIDTVTQ